MQDQDKIFHIPPSLISDLKGLGITVRDLVMYINSKCNLRCKHCYIGNSLLALENQISATSIRDFFIACKRLDRITIIGGEPTLHQDINLIIESLKLIPIAEKRITTNLVKIENFDYVNAKRNNLRVCVSIDGHNAELHEEIRGKNTFGKTVSNIKTLLDNGVDIEITHTITSKNISHFFELVTFCKSIGITRLNLHRVSLQGNALVNKDLYVSPTQWRNLTNEIEIVCNKKLSQTLNVRFPLLFTNEKEFKVLTEQKIYNHHPEKSYYSNESGNRIIIYPDRKLFISSEAFGTESYIAEIIGNKFHYNPSDKNEIELYKEYGEAGNYSTNLLNKSFEGDEKFPISLSVSFKMNVQL